MFSERPSRLPGGRGEVAGAAGSDESEPAVAAARQESTKHGNMLAEIYSWFTEGFDTKDLQEAKALLEELKH